MSTGTGGLTALQDCGVLQQEVPLAEFTTWRVGGPAQWLAEPISTEQIPELLQWAREEGLPVLESSGGCRYGDQCLDLHECLLCPGQKHKWFLHHG